ncbi:MAG TPA: hypothetical protein PLE74_11700 [Candidatus Cloacimonadota bacterium]|nr:hypothetical protein [Candidatus Cloacimonadota bacterium]HPT72928.1 hypothetical protein [Candidatus Cloacimonadota bacterium]
MFRNSKGFSIYSIISIIAALTLIFVLALPSFFNVNKKQKQTECIKNMEEIYRAINQYMNDKKADFKGDAMDLKTAAYLKTVYECPEDGMGDKYQMSGKYNPAGNEITVTCPNAKDFPSHVIPQSFLDSMKPTQ